MKIAIVLTISTLKGNSISLKRVANLFALTMEDAYSYNLLLNLEILKDYTGEANAMHQWATKANSDKINQYPYQASFWLNEISDVDERLGLLIEYTKFNTKLSKQRQFELRHSLMFFCFEIEKQLLNTFLNDYDYLRLINIGSKIIKIREKELRKLTVNRIAINDEIIANKVVEQTCNLLAEKFIKCAKFTPFKDKSTIENIITFTTEFRKASETEHLQILGSWAQAIRIYLHTEGLMISRDRTKLNTNRKSDFPLTNEQSEFIYNLFELFNLITPRKKEGLNANLYIRNCIAKYLKAVS